MPLTFLLLNAGEWRIHRDMLHKRTPPLGRALRSPHAAAPHDLRDRRHGHPLDARVLPRAHPRLRHPRRRLRRAADPGGAVARASGCAIRRSCSWRRRWPTSSATSGCTCPITRPRDSFVGRLQIIQRLRRHHAVHHAPELMQKWNFNVTIPLWDWVRRTIYRGEDETFTESADDFEQKPLMQVMPAAAPQQSAVVVHFSNSCEQLGCWLVQMSAPPSPPGRQ